MGNIRFKDNKILFVGNQIAAHDDCCCEEEDPNIIPDCVCCSEDDSYGVDGNCPRYISATVEWIGGGIGMCEGLEGTFILEISGSGCSWNWSDPWSGSCSIGAHRISNMYITGFGSGVSALIGCQQCPYGTWVNKGSTCGNVCIGLMDIYTDDSCNVEDDGDCDGGSGTTCYTDGMGWYKCWSISWFPCDEFGDPL